jgi:DNA-binding GntR family transcriptional regulator
LAILQGYFEPGEKLDQDLIATEYEASRTPVREAVRVLESEGFVQVRPHRGAFIATISKDDIQEIRPHRGAFIATISKDDIQEIYEVRKLIEAEIVRQVTLLIPDSVLDELEESLDENQEQLEVDDKAGHVSNDIYFHNTIVQFVENKLLKEVLESLNNRTARVRRFAQLQPGFHLVESLEEHRAVFRAMQQRDPEAAAEAMRVHLENSSLRIQQSIV